jgi:hypothetical protein
MTEPKNIETERLIERLAAELRPVRPLRPPLVRAGLWLAFALVVVAAIVWSHGLRPDLLERFARPDVRLEWFASLLTGVLAAVATFYLSLPDRSARWALLPLPGLALWLATLGYGCLLDWFAYGPDGLVPGVSFACFQSIVATSIPLGLGLLLMVRHAGPVRPTLTTTTGALAVAALAASGLSLYHHVDAAIMVLIWHVGTIAIVVAVGHFTGPRLLRWIGPRRI